VSGADDTLTWRRLWAETTEVLDDQPAARWLCEVACALDGDEFLAALDEPATERMVAHLDAMVARYRAGEPLAYVLGRWSFRRLDLFVDRRVLIPRPETELVAEVAIERATARLGAHDGPLLVADLGTGSGAIGLSLAAELPLGRVEVWLTDASEEALDVARANLAGLGRHGAGVRLAAGSWFSALPAELRGQLDLVVSNPPYVADADPEVAPSVREWEPSAAVFSGADGLDALRAVVGEVAAWLRPGGWVVLEIGHRQGHAVRALLEAARLTDVEVRPDLAGRERIAVARRPG
jgi:release factor glutamine methyltransferase